MEPISGDALRGHLETMTLSSLEKGEAHGFEILRRLTEAGSGALRLTEGSLYPALYRLEQAGLIASMREDGSVPRRGRRKRVYRLTRRGEKRLAAGRVEFQQFVRVIGTILGAPA